MITLYDLTQVLMNSARLVLVLVGLCALYRLVRNRYVPGDLTRFSLGAAAAASLNATVVRLAQGYQAWGTHGTAELIASNLFYIATISLLIYFVLTEIRTLR